MSNIMKSQLMLALFAAGAMAFAAEQTAAVSAAVPAKEEGKAATVADANKNKMDRTDVAMQENVANYTSARNSGDDLVKEANSAYAAGKLDDARKLYLEAVLSYRKAQGEMKDIQGEESGKKIEYCRTQIVRAYMTMARNAEVQAEKLYESKNYDEAIAMLKEAVKYAPERKESLEAKIVKCEQRRKEVKVLEDTKEATLMPEKENQDYRIQVLMRQGREFAANGKFDDALRKFQEVQLIDPFNNEAIQASLGMTTRIMEGTDQRYRALHRKSITETEWSWAKPIYPETEAAASALTGPVVKSEQEQSPLQKKLKTIRIPKMDLDDVSVPTAIRYLQEESKRNDPEGVGINIFFMRSAAPAVAAPAGAAAAPAADEGAPVATVVTSSASAMEDAGPKITTLIVNKNLLEAIASVCSAAKMRYRVERHAVVIAPENVAIDEMETRLFPVEPSAFQGKVADDGGNSEELKKYFEALGVRFPAGAKIIFDKRISRLIATNTIENLVALEGLIEELLSSKEPLVEISAKFVEVNENDLQELGFNYTLNYNPDNAPYSMVPNPFNPNLPDVTTDSFASHRLSFKDNDALNSTLTSEPTITMGGFAKNGDLAWSAAINAVNQVDSKDTLSSPRVVTLQNQKAYIEMVLNTYFPDTYTNGTSTVNSGSNNNTGSSNPTYTTVSPMPNFTDPTPLGIRMEIQPTVDLARRTITIDDFKPIVTSFIGWTEYSVYTTTSGENLVRKPILDVRDISTSLTIYDGETVVVGGVIDDRIETINDKYPILGDLPLVGRLFQSKGTKAARRNLLIFISCRLVKPDGTAFFPGDAHDKGYADLGRSYWK